MTTDPSKTPTTSSDASDANSDSDPPALASAEAKPDLAARAEAVYDSPEFIEQAFKGLADVAGEWRIAEIARSHDALEALREKELTARVTIEKQAEVRLQQISLQRHQVRAGASLRKTALVAVVFVVTALILIGALTGTLATVMDALTLVCTPLAFIGSGAAVVLWRQRGSKESGE